MGGVWTASLQARSSKRFNSTDESNCEPQRPSSDPRFAMATFSRQSGRRMRSVESLSYIYSPRAVFSSRN
jgi:hypothetical protein